MAITKVDEGYVSRYSAPKPFISPEVIRITFTVLAIAGTIFAACMGAYSLAGGVFLLGIGLVICGPLIPEYLFELAVMLDCQFIAVPILHVFKINPNSHRFLLDRAPVLQAIENDSAWLSATLMQHPDVQLVSDSEEH